MHIFPLILLYLKINWKKGPFLHFELFAFHELSELMFWSVMNFHVHQKLLEHLVVLFLYGCLMNDEY